MSKEDIEKIRQMPDDILLELWKLYQVRNLDIKPTKSQVEIKGIINKNQSIETEQNIPNISNELLGIDKDGNVRPFESSTDYLSRVFGLEKNKIPKKINRIEVNKGG